MRHRLRADRACDAGEVLWDGRPIGLSEATRLGYMPEERGLSIHGCRFAARIYGCGLLHSGPRIGVRTASRLTHQA